MPTKTDTTILLELVSFAQKSSAEVTESVGVKSQRFRPLLFFLELLIIQDYVSLAGYQELVFLNFLSFLGLFCFAY